jgi:hypothetical protein
MRLAPSAVVVLVAGRRVERLGSQHLAEREQGRRVRLAVRVRAAAAARLEAAHLARQAGLAGAYLVEGVSKHHSKQAGSDPLRQAQRSEEATPPAARSALAHSAEALQRVHSALPPPHLYLAPLRRPRLLHRPSALHHHLPLARHSVRLGLAPSKEPPAPSGHLHSAPLAAQGVQATRVERGHLDNRHSARPLLPGPAGHLGPVHLALILPRLHRQRQRSAAGAAAAEEVSLAVPDQAPEVKVDPDLHLALRHLEAIPTPIPTPIHRADRDQRLVSRALANPPYPHSAVPPPPPPLQGPVTHLEVSEQQPHSLPHLAAASQLQLHRRHRRSVLQPLACLPMRLHHSVNPHRPRAPVRTHSAQRHPLRLGLLPHRRHLVRRPLPHLALPSQPALGHPLLAGSALLHTIQTPLPHPHSALQVLPRHQPSPRALSAPPNPLLHHQHSAHPTPHRLPPRPPYSAPPRPVPSRPLHARSALPRTPLPRETG